MQLLLIGAREEAHGAAGLDKVCALHFSSFQGFLAGKRARSAAWWEWPLTYYMGMEAVIVERIDIPMFPIFGDTERVHKDRSWPKDLI